MLRPVRMQRLRVVVLQRDQRVVLRELGRLGAVELARAQAGAGTAPLPPPDHGGELARCDRLRARVAELRQLLGVERGAGPALVVERTLAEAEEVLTTVETQARALAVQHANCLSRTDALETAAGPVVNLRGLEVPLGAVGQFEFLHFVTGSLPEESAVQLNLGDEAAVFLGPAHGQRRPAVAATLRWRRAMFDAALERAGFRAERLPAGEAATATEWLARARHERERLQAEAAEAESALATLATRSAGLLDEVEVWAGQERRLLEAEQDCPRTEATVLLTGWIPAPAAAAVRQQLLHVTGGRCVLEILAASDVSEEEIPILLRSPWWLRPFEMLVTAYGLPKYGEVAPTLFVAVSFVLMFGMMFGDVGHGGLLALGGGVLLLISQRFTRNRAGQCRDAGVLLVFNGASSMAFGAVYGSYFGLPHWKELALWHDPLEGDPLDLMRLAIGVGVVLMSTGLVLNIVNRLGQRDWLDGVFGRFGLMGLLFYWGALALVVTGGAMGNRPWWSAAAVVMLGLPAASWVLRDPLIAWCRRRHAHNASGEGVAAALTESLVGAFESVLLYLANTVSFVRLAAYAMSHAALLLAAFTLAAEVGRLAVGGAALRVLVIVLGNLAALLLEGIVASVQALRLEYYEFFGKFFTGEGRPFKPFCLAASSA